MWAILVVSGAASEHRLSKRNFSKNMEKTSHFVFCQNPLDLHTNAIKLWEHQAFLYILNIPCICEHVLVSVHLISVIKLSSIYKIFLFMNTNLSL